MRFMAIYKMKMKHIKQFKDNNMDNKGRFNYDVGTKSGLNGIYNEKAKHVERMQRPMASSGSANVPFIQHQGVRVTTDQENQYLIHKGGGYGKSSQTVVTNASHMSNKWQSMGSRDLSGNQNVGSFVRAGGDNYNVLSDNCIGGAKRMFNNGK